MNKATTTLKKFRYSVNGRKLELDHVIIEQPLQIRLLWQAQDCTELQSKVDSFVKR